MNVHYFKPNFTKINLSVTNWAQMVRNKPKYVGAENESMFFIPDLLISGIDGNNK